jgi:hypothetical protein
MVLLYGRMRRHDLTSVVVKGRFSGALKHALVSWA